MSEQERVLAGGGEMGALMRSRDWSQTPMGPVEGWPPALRAAIGLMLGSPYAMALFWGPELIQFYNDSFCPIIGGKHPTALGQPARRTFAEIWDAIGALFAEVMRTQTAVSQENQPFFMNRQGFPEEAYFTFSYMPLRDEHGTVMGVCDMVTETTRQVLGERRFTCIRELSIRTALAQDSRGVLHAAQAVLAQSGPDVPFALLYHLDSATARLALRSGLEQDASAAPRQLALGDETSPWPLAEVRRSGQERLVEDLGSRLGPLHAGPWPEPVSRALLIPLALGGGAGHDAVLVVGLSPRLPLDENYRDFLQLLARQLSADVARARALEQETQRAAQLAELDRSKTAFFSNVSHEFRTPLTLMLGPLEDTLSEALGPLTSAQHERLGLVQRNATRLLKLVNNLLEVSRLEAGGMRARLRPTDLAPLTAGLVSAFDSAVNKVGLRLEVDCPPLPEPVWVDPDMWEKVVLNLVSNAFKFTFTGTLRVRLRWRGDRVELSVTDTGTGIPAEQLPHLFERFHRVEGARGRSHEGSGIGLALVREIIHLHGGSVHVESTPGQGSTFTVDVPTGQAHLPAGLLDAPPPADAPSPGPAPFLDEVSGWLDTPPPPGAPAPPAPPSTEARPLEGHILLAEDNADMRGYIQRLLEGRYSLQAVADGAAALEAARTRVPDLVLSDVMMPGLDGFELVRALRASPLTAHVPILLLSARAGEEAAVEGLQAGADGYLVKPFSARQLLARVRSSMHLARERSARERFALERADFEQYLIGIVSHDLRNPLSAISLSASALLRRKDLEERVQRYLGRILSSAERAQRMIHDLLDFTRARLGGGLPVECRALDFHALTRQVVEELRAATPGRELKLEQHGDGQVVWDGDRVAQVLTNLATNALHYSPPGTPVRVSTRGEAEEGVLEVHNEGPPIAAELLAQLFQPLKRGVEGDSASRSVGLGLYIVEQLVRAHGGRIDVRSEAGEGTTFRVRLPRRGPASSQDMKGQPS